MLAKPLVVLACMNARTFAPNPTKALEIGSRPRLQHPDGLAVCIVGLALVALTLKLTIAFNTIGTNDAVIFYGFAKVLSTHSLEWTYRHSIYFNHPPLTAYYLRGIYFLTEQKWCQEIGVHFPLLLRLPGILADFVLVLVLLRMSKAETGLRIPAWALALFAFSPVSLMVSGFHGNTDSVMVLFLVCAGFMCMRNRPALCGLFFALGCQIKIVSLLLFPVFVFFWFSQHKPRAFLLSSLGLSAVLWWEPLVKFPGLFVENVLSYGSYWGIWGLTYCLRLTGLPGFSRVSFFHLATAQTLIIVVLKALIIASVFLIAWRRRHFQGHLFINSLGYAWIVFFLFSPGVCAQYLVWLAPFILILSPTLYAYLLAASSLFLFLFYNITGGGLPWSVAISTDELRESWAPWSLLPWAVLIVGSVALWKKAAEKNSAFRLLSFDTLRAESTQLIGEA
jgi:hypothetical protein